MTKPHYYLHHALVGERAVSPDGKPSILKATLLAADGIEMSTSTFIFDAETPEELMRKVVQSAAHVVAATVQGTDYSVEYANKLMKEFAK